MAEGGAKVRGFNVKDVPAQEFVVAFATHLKRSGKVELPSWTDLVKTGVYKELAPYDPDWYYVRMASLARKVYVRKGSGVGKFTRAYGGHHRRGSVPPHFGKAAGGVIRSCLQSLEKLGFVEKDSKSGRRITKLGQQELDRVATELGRSS
eukprot:CAMPEP_0117049136 /NCGR_PEP_ID=MMETSP0472-20121206/33958_1 /TAXON_ID=693140 ORGANISM="Tiarina fusus, Strain LIS" /NCGR_SAMPLE_ID=MMETSP0472 /ASSEMBLY_ACC=CAM_ASM_000603 /LENGTH=149 /DNA_ID=CAMNT_0004762487 /DNA_START=12 /DNA_END=461 /DNA_ORIENTATION=-